MTVYIFPGQGSQSIGMGRDLFQKFSNITAKADAILGYSIQSLCLETSQSQLSQTQYTQPALYVVNALAYLNKIQGNGRKPTFVAGHSLGEYNALLAADVFDFETGLSLVKKRGELMSQAKDGGMAAVIGLNAEVIKTILTQHNLLNVTIANYNSHAQTIISGKKNDVETAQILCEQFGDTRVIPLAVNGAFHSPFMSDAQKQYENYLSDFKFNTPSIPVIGNTTARPYRSNEIHKNLIEQIVSPVRWVESIEYLLAQGESEFEEVGVGMVLTGLVNRIKNGN